MELNTKKGFSLIELILATLMFGFMMMSLASIYSTANKHMFQSYRQNAVKSNASMAMKTITARLAEANRVDAPAVGANGDSLRFAVNVDQNSSCAPINTAVQASWHEICYVPGRVMPQCPFGNCLYHHTGVIPIPGGSLGCPDGGVWGAVYPSAVLGCGIQQAGTTVTQLAAFVQPPFGGTIFSRSGPAGNTVINIRLRIVWDPAVAAVVGRDFRTTGTAIDTTLTTSVRVGRSGQ